MSFSILLVFEKPDSSDLAAVENWQRLSNKLQGVANNNKGTQLLGENCLLLPIDQGLEVFYDVVLCTRGVPYRYTTIPNEAIRWLEKKEGVWVYHS